MNDLARTNQPARSQTPVHFPEVPDYAIAALTLEWNTCPGCPNMSDNIIVCTLDAYQSACKAWGIHGLVNILTWRGKKICRMGRERNCRDKGIDLNFVQKELENVMAQWPESNLETYVAFEMPGFVLEAAKAQLPAED